MSTFALKYRPRTLDDLVGQPAVQVVLQRLLQSGKIPSAMLLSGSHGTGKTTTARIIAAALNCLNGDPCAHCDNCRAVYDGSSLDVLEIDAASNGLVEDVRALRQQILYRHTGRYRVVIFDEAQSASKAAFNAMLKILEEPPPDTLFLLLTTEPAAILNTITSRCMPLQFKRISIDHIINRLQHVAHTENITADTALLRLIAEKANGAMRDALVHFDLAATIGLTTAEQHRRIYGHHDHAPAMITPLTRADLRASIDSSEEAYTRTADPTTLIDDICRLFTDLILLRHDGSISHSGKPLADRQNLALILDDTTITNCLKVCWQIRAMRGDTRNTLQHGLVLLADVIAAAMPAPARLTLTEMAKF